MKKIIALIVGFAPALALAANPVIDATTLTTKLVDISNVAIYLLVALAIIFIIWNVVMALIYGSDPAAKTKALGNIGYGVLGLAIIVSIWGLVNIIVGTFSTVPSTKPIPNVSNSSIMGGIPVNQMPVVR
ncbi:MAG: hypothetical protein AAB777_02335 [Patescibacteria group bacterium]